MQPASAYYKLTDNNPAASWATVDWRGVPKIAFHILRGAYRPLHVCLLVQIDCPFDRRAG